MAVYTAVDKSTDYFEPKLYTGNGGTNNITGLDFQPDWCWLKSRSGGFEHAWYDAPRGATQDLSSSTDEQEQDFNTKLTAFNSDGFSLGSNAGVNQNTTTYASWNWKANGQGSSNTAGSINSTYTSASTTSGVSIVTYSGNGSAGATVGHGLGKTPTMMIVKCRSAAGEDWMVYHEALGPTKHMSINNANSPATATTSWNDTAPTSTLFSLGSNGKVNGSGKTYGAWIFTDIQGFSKMSEYQGNGNKNGPFIYCSFAPAFVMCKKYSGADNWMMFTNKISSSTGTDGGYNVHSRLLEANGAGAEQSAGTGDGINFLSNGFKIIEDNGNLNGSGANYLFMAFAENPFVTSSGVPGLAR